MKNGKFRIGVTGVALFVSLWVSSSQCGAQSTIMCAEKKQPERSVCEAEDALKKAENDLKEAKKHLEGQKEKPQLQILNSILAEVNSASFQLEVLAAPPNPKITIRGGSVDLKDSAQKFEN